MKTSLKNPITLLNKWKKDHKHDLNLARANYLALMPGAFITFLGLVLFAKLSFFSVIAGTVILGLGIVVLKLTWRFLKFKYRVERFLKEVEGRVIIGGLGGMTDSQAINPEEFIPQKKIFYH